VSLASFLVCAIGRDVAISLPLLSVMHMATKLQ